MKNFSNTISIIGLGFVGSAMAVAISSIKKNYRIVGIEKNNTNGKFIISKLKKGIFPFKINDNQLLRKTKFLKNSKVFDGTFDISKIFNSKIIICSINFDIIKTKKGFRTNSIDYLKSINEIATHINPNSTIIFESTLPPGYCENKILPIFNEVFKQRGISKKNIKLAFSFERVMPGKNYLDSIRNMHRVYSANNKNAEKACEYFLRKLINTKKFPLMKMENIRSAEIAKVLENTYRATNIAFIDEWTKFSEKLNININKVIDCIKVRSTHNNIMRPGLGVGGYCLTKDSLLAQYSSKNIYNFKKINFPISSLGFNINSKMPLHTFNVIKKIMKKNLKNKKILICGASYKNDIGDTRYSPSQLLFKKLFAEKSKIEVYDPFLNFWKELNIKTLKKIKKINSYDLIIFAVNHNNFKNISFKSLSRKNLIIDTCSSLSSYQKNIIKKNKISCYEIGKGFLNHG